MKGKDVVKYHINKRYDSMMGRCYRPKDPSFKNYGEKGIRVCSGWILDIRSFREWFLAELLKLTTKEEFSKRPSDWQLDRIDPNGHYTPKNCRITSPQENSRNKKSGRREVISAEGEAILI